MSKNIYLFVRRNKLFSRLITGFVVLFLSTAWLLPVFTGTADAAQLTSRSLTLSTAQPSVTGVTYTFGFTIGASSTSQIEGIKFIACTTALGSYQGGTCTAPTGMTGAGNGFTGVTFSSQTGFQGATNFAVDLVGANDCTAAGNVACLKRTDVTAQTGSSAKTVVLASIKNPSAVNTTFYVGIVTYTTTTWTVGSVVDTGSVASAIVQTLTINAAVAEILNFCVGSTSVDNATSQTYTGCSTMTGTSVNLGTLDSAHINVTPVSANCSAGDCSKNGVAMVQSNAINGTTVYYDSIQQSGTNHVGTLRISGATCTNDTANASVDQTDSCFNERPAAANFTAGTERYGMTVAAINCGTVAAYTCTFSTGAYNLARTSNYNSTGANTYTTDANQITGTSNSTYAWDESGTAVQLASSSASTTKQVDNEALILKFAATPAITTPFGAYTAKADFIAVSTY